MKLHKFLLQNLDRWKLRSKVSISDYSSDCHAVLRDSHAVNERAKTEKNDYLISNGLDLSFSGPFYQTLKSEMSRELHLSPQKSGSPYIFYL